EMDLRLQQLWILFLLLLILMSCGVNGTFKTPRRQNIVPSYCKYVLAEPLVFQRWCVGAYPWLAFIKYQDRMIKVGEPYALYLPLSQESVLVLHKRSPLLKCRNLVFKDSNTFFCLDRNVNRTIVVKDASVHCIPFHNYLTDDLMNSCLKKNEYHHKDKYLVEVMRTRRCIFHYTLSDQGAKPSHMPVILLILIVLVLLQLH
ncbi:hypothetical protein KR032_007601, partial [Drosophila birchii]